MTECEHIWIRVDDDYEGDFDEGPNFMKLIPAHWECSKCEKCKTDDQLEDEIEH